jgi:hypothetical protein
MCNVVLIDWNEAKSMKLVALFLKGSGHLQITALLLTFFALLCWY